MGVVALDPGVLICRCPLPTVTQAVRSDYDGYPVCTPHSVNAGGRARRPPMVLRMFTGSEAMGWSFT